MYRGIPRFYFFPKNSDVECLFLCLPIEYMCILHIFFGEVPFKSLPIFRIRLFAFLFLSLESLKWIIGVNLLAHRSLANNSPQSVACSFTVSVEGHARGWPLLCLLLRDCCLLLPDVQCFQNYCYIYLSDFIRCFLMTRQIQSLLL